MNYRKSPPAVGITLFYKEPSRLYKKVKPFLFFVVLICMEVPAWGAEPQIHDGQYLGIGPSHYSINSDHPSIGNQSISGISLTWGLIRSNFAFELSIGGGSGIETDPTPDIYYPADKADLTVMNISYHYLFTNLNGLDNAVPYVGVGYGFTSFIWSTYVYDHTGEGLVLVAGAIINFDQHWAVNFSARQYNTIGHQAFFSYGSSPSYDTAVREFAAILEFHFN